MLYIVLAFKNLQESLKPEIGHVKEDEIQRTKDLVYDPPLHLDLRTLIADDQYQSNPGFKTARDYTVRETEEGRDKSTMPGELKDFEAAKFRSRA